jgi:uncharacterized protein
LARRRDGVNLLVLSDTHVPDFAKRLPDSLVPHLAGADAVLHAGDVTAAFVLDELAEKAPVYSVVGNNDREEIQAWGATVELRLDLEGVRIAMVHEAGPRRGRVDRLRRRFPDADLIVFGHSHIPVNEEHEGVRFLNPGSPTWKRRQPQPTLGLIDLDEAGFRTRIIPLGA